MSDDMPPRSIPLPGGRHLPLQTRPLVMGILNCTPDSFSDGAEVPLSTRVGRAMEMIEAGADCIDIGGESTRPGARPVPAGEECRRVVPVLESIRRESAIPLSIDTTKVEVAQAALDAGADIVNDITAGRGDAGMFDLVARRGAGLVLMHMQGTPETMQDAPAYTDVVAEVRRFLLERAAAAEAAGVGRASILLDPGFGFGKTLAQNVALFQALPEVCAAGYPVLVGVSRKSMIGALTGLPVGERLEGSLAAGVLAAVYGAAVLRVHDVRETVRALAVVRGLQRGAETG